MVSVKKQTQLYCSECLYRYRKWQGRCDGCGAWNTIIQGTATHLSASVGSSKPPISLADASSTPAPRIASGISELDRVLGGGFITGSVSLLGGAPGIGKSTLTMQIAQAAAKKGKRVLYVTGEESLDQVVLRAERIGPKEKSILLLSETNIDAICQVILQEKVDLVLIDSIQVMVDPQLQALAGSVTQVRSCADRFISCIKAGTGIGLMVGHITRDGTLAGPKVLEHMVDCIFYLEGEHQRGYRLLRSYKNRYSSTDDIGLFSMQHNGLHPLDEAGHFFIDPESMRLPGSVIAAVDHGGRPLLVEVQALVVDSGHGQPKRSFVGVDGNRTHLLIATLEKSCGLRLHNKDIFINIVGGLKIVEPGLDLAICIAIISSFKNQLVPNQMGVIGEVGLTGEIRAITQLKQRLQELQRLGLKQCLAPKRNTDVLDKNIGLAPLFVSHLSEIIAKFK